MWRASGKKGRLEKKKGRRGGTHGQINNSDKQLSSLLTMRKRRENCGGGAEAGGRIGGVLLPAGYLLSRYPGSISWALQR